MAQEGRGGQTSLTCYPDTRDRLRELKPYESLSWDEFLGELADVYEKHADPDAEARAAEAVSDAD